MEQKTTGKTELYSDFHGSVKVAKYAFDRVKVFRGSDGEVVQELPYNQTLTLIKTGDRRTNDERCLWLTSDQVRELLNKLDECSSVTVEVALR